MSAELNFFDTYILMAIVEEIVPRQTFFKDRYFPTGDDDIFASDKVLTEYRKGDRKMAAFVSARAGDIPMERFRMVGMYRMGIVRRDQEAVCHPAQIGAVPLLQSLCDPL